MKRRSLVQKNFSFALSMIAVFLFAGSERVFAQSEPSKVEVGVQFSTIRFGEMSISEPGFGGRFTYNINKHVAVETEVNLFPRDPEDYVESLKGGHKTQVLFGIKAGTRSRRIGLFLKIRPGLVNFSNLTRLPCGCNAPPPKPSETDFALDVGGVLEVYTSRRTFIRVDLGDTIVHSNSGNTIELPGSVKQEGSFVIKNVIRSTSHNPQLNVGVGFRLFEKAQGQNRDNAGKLKKRVPRYEIGAQFSSLSITKHSVICFSVCLSGDDRTYSEPGGGARFTYNLSDNIALEAEGNLFPRDHMDIGFGPMGRMAQGQFGVKVGKRFGKLGAFGKIRPGFVSFSRVSYLISTFPLDVYGGHFTIGNFGFRKERYFSTDVGGVIEFYPSRHLMTRVDLGDTIIRYREVDAPGFSLIFAIQRFPPETRHNFQFAAGVGLRF
jgi:outer membrane protein with beta-barrel domain